MQGTRPDDVRPDVLVTDRFERLIAGRGEDRDRPCAVVAREREQRHRAERGEAAGPALRLCAPEVARVVREARVRLLRRWGPRAGCPQPPVGGRLAAGRIHDEVGAKLAAVGGADAVHVRCPRDG